MQKLFASCVLFPGQNLMTQLCSKILYWRK